jgi:ankyrin repeat protein
MNSKSEEIDTPLTLAVRKNKPELVLLLLRGGADPDLPGRVRSSLPFLPLPPLLYFTSPSGLWILSS